MASSSYSNSISGQPMQQHNDHQQYSHQHQQHQPQHQHMAVSSHVHLHPPSPRNVLASPVISRETRIVDENFIVQDYRPPGTMPSPNKHPGKNENSRNEHEGISSVPRKNVQWVYNPIDGSVLVDHNGVPLTVDRLLATKPLRHELSTRPGPGNKKLTYISGDDVSRTLNDVFGFDGWDLDIKDVSRIDASRDPKTGKHTILYTALVRLTHKASGAYKEDCGAGDSTDKSYATAIAHALKASITDAMKRAARHFGDKLGNSLYAGNFSISKAPVSLKDALDKYDIHRCNTKFGFQQPTKPASSVAHPTTSNKAVGSTSIPSAATIANPPPRVHPPGKAKQNTHDQQKQQHRQHQQQRLTSVPNASAGNKTVENDKNEDSQQNQQQHQRQALPQQKQQSSSSPYNAADVPGCSNGGRGQPSANSSFPSSNGSGPSNSGVSIESATSSTMVRPTSSYGRRPNMGSTNNCNASSANSGSAQVQGTAVTGPSFISNNNHISSSSSNNNNNNSSSDNSNARRVSLGNQQSHQQQRQSMSKNGQHLNVNHSNNINKAHTVSQTTPTYGSSGNTNNHYSNLQHKRPPLGNIIPNPSPSGASSDFAAKRPKQQHHNPYQQSYNGGRKSI